MKRETSNPVYRCIILLFIAMLPFAGRAQDAKKPGHIVFIENSFKEALRQAGIQHKYIFVDAYASWCGPCKMLRATTFKNNKAADFFNEKFINVSIDMEKGEGPTLSDQWGIQAYPTLIIFDSNGKGVLSSVGYIGAGDLLKFGKAALNKGKI